MNCQKCSVPDAPSRFTCVHAREHEQINPGSAIHRCVCVYSPALILYEDREQQDPDLGVYTPDAETVLSLLPTWFHDYNENGPHKGLNMLSPRQFRRLHAN